MGTDQRTTSAPYDRHTLARMQNNIAVIWLGRKSFSAGLSSDQQNDVNDKLDDAVDFISSKAFGGYPWWRRKTTLTMADGTSRYALPSDFKRMKVVSETVGGKTREIGWIPEHIYEASWGDTLVNTHPLEGDQINARPWILGRGWSNDSPPVYVVERRPTPTSVEDGGTINCLYVPYSGKFTDNQYNVLPPSGRRAVLHYAKWKLAVDRGDTAQIAVQKDALYEEIAVLQQHEGDVSEEINYQQLPGNFVSEVTGGP